MRKLTLAEEIAEVIADHAAGLDQTACYYGNCVCGEKLSEDDHAIHQAKEVLTLIFSKFPDP